MTTVIEQLHDPARQRAIARATLGDLPAWFGLPDATAEYVVQAGTLPFWAAVVEGVAVGFLDLKPTSAATVELACMGVRRAYHRAGLGRQLVAAALAYARPRYRFMQVKTVAPGHYPEYDATNRFYAAIGFWPLEVFPDLWDEWNPCLVLVQAL